MSLKKTLKRLNFFKYFSLRLRLTFLFVFIFGSTMLFFSYILYSQTLQTLQQDFDDALFNYSVDVSDSIEVGAKGDLLFPPLKFDRGKILPFPLGTALIQVVHISGTVLSRVGEFGQFAPPYKKDFEKIALGEEASYRTITDTDNIPQAEAESYRMISFPLDSASRPQLLLQIAVPMTLMETQAANRLRFIEFGIPIVLVIATLAGLFFSSRALAPIGQMIAKSQAISALDLSQRLPVPEANDEIRKLSQTMNEMLSRIEKAFSSHERFVADASHQLLTPLTILRGEMELLQRNNDGDVRGFLKSGLQEVDHLTKIVQDMLLLARIDAGTAGLNLSDLSLDEILIDSISRVSKIATAKNIHIRFNIGSETPGAFKVRGDEDLLNNLFINIIENAVKYSKEGQIVEVRLESRQNSSLVSIEDHGPGIPVDQMEHIFERFSRVPKLSTQVKGYGLGLAIAQKIAKLHNSLIRVENLKPTGSLFSLEINNI